VQHAESIGTRRAHTGNIERAIVNLFARRVLDVRRPMPEKLFSAVSLLVFDGFVASVARSHRTKPNDVMNMSPMLAAFSVTIDPSPEFVIALRGVRERLELPWA